MSKKLKAPAADARAPSGRTGDPAPSPATKRGRERLSAEARKDSIIRAAQEVFSRTSFHGARTRDVALAADVNQATLFQHFRTKEELFEQAVLQPLVDSMGGLNERMKDYRAAATPEEFLALLRPGMRRYVDVMSAIFPLLTAALFSDRESGKKFYREKILPFLEQQSATFGPDVRSFTDPDLLALFSFGIVFVVVLDREFGDKDRDLDPVIEELIRLTATGAFESRSRYQESAQHASEDAP